MTTRAHIQTAVRIASALAGLGLLLAPPLAAIAGRQDTRARQFTIAFVSTRHNPSIDTEADPARALSAAEIYLMNEDGTAARRLTDNAAFDGFPALSPDGARVVFDSNRLRREGEAFNLSDLFVMNADGSGQTALVRGSSATWSPDGQK